MKKIIEEAKKELENRGYVCDTVEVFKDGIYKTGISVRRTADEMVGVNIYPDETTPVGEQINKFIECYKNTQIDFEPANLLRWNEVKKNVILQVHRKYNRSVIPAWDFADLEVTARVIVAEDAGQIATMEVSDNELHVWGISKEELYKTALKNTEERVRIIAMFGDMFAVTNKSRVHGAASVLCESVIGELKNIFGNRFVLIPSSVHEFLAVAYNSEMQLSGYSDMVKEVNATAVEAKDQLSDHAYLYDDGEILCI